MIEARGLSKRYGSKMAVDDLSFTVRPGHVTGFLGPNGAGKTTTMRMILGLDRPTAGSVTVNGRPFAGLFSAMREAFAAVSLAVSLAASFAAFFAGQAILAGKHIGTTLGQPGVLRAMLLSAAAVTVFGLLAYGAGALIRHTTGAVTAILGALFLLPLLGQALPSSWYNEIVRWLPGATALGPITSSAPPPPAEAPHLFSAWGEFAVFCGYAAVLLAAGAWSFLRRDV